MKRTLSIILMLAMLASLFAALPLTASAEPSTAGCTGPKSPDGKHDWIGRQRDPWCTYGGGIVWGCRYCQKEVFEETTPALGHNWDDWYTSSNADCTHAGEQTRCCKRCQTRDTQPIPAIGHKWDSGTVTKQPTCTEAGQKTVHCTNKFASHNCTATKKETVPALGHSWGAWVEFIPGTCMKKQVLQRTCSRCGEVDYWTKDYGDHDWGEWTVVKEPTATEDGLRERVCKIYEGHREEEVIPATGEPAPDVKPSLYHVVSWAPDAGEGKRYEGAILTLHSQVTNTGNCTVYVDPTDYNPSVFFNMAFPSGTAFVPQFGKVMAAVEPGESWSYDWYYTVNEWEVQVGSVDYDEEGLVAEGAQYIDADDATDYVGANHGVIHIPLTYPEGTTPEEEKPALKLTVTQTTPEKEAYTNTDHSIPDNDIISDVTVTNTGKVPLRFCLFVYRGSGFSYETNTYFKYDFILNPGESWNKSDFWYYVVNLPKFFVPDPEDSPYAGNYPIRFKVYGYAVDDTGRTTPICESNPVDFNHKIAKPGPTPWPIPEESKLEVKVSTMDAPADPAGYQLGEDWGASVKFYNAAPVEAIDPNLHIDFTATDTEYNTIWSKTNGPTWVEYQKWPIFNPTTVVTLPFYGVITEEDVQRGYVEVSGYVKWTDPDSGKEKIAYSNVWNVPVISKTGLLLQKKASDPANGSYFVPGEKVDWTLTVTNNSKEPIRNVTVTDGGIVVATFAEIAAGETKNCPVPSTTVTDYDAQVTGYVSNVAKATGTDVKDATHTWYSNVAKADCGDDTPPVLGAKPGLSAVKTDKGPQNGSYYEEGEEITFEVTVTNTGDCELNDLKFYDSLAGFTPVDTLASLPVAGSHTFEYKYTVKPADMGHPTLTNGATITYTFLGMPGTPATCSCKVKIGEGDTETEDPDPPFDPGILKGDGEDYCKLEVAHLMQSEAHYTLHACSEHTAAASGAGTADPAAACAIWWAEIDKLYETLYAAGNSEAKAVLLAERAEFNTYAANYGALYGDEALAELLRFKCAELCCMMHTASETQPSSLTMALSGKLNGTENDATVREVGAMTGSDCDVTERYAGAAARAFNGVLDLLREAKTYDRVDVFLRGQAFWQAALDEKVNAAYAAADRDQRKLIILWRTGLDALLAAERPLLILLYPDNAAMAEEILMNMIKDAGFAE